MRQSLLNSFNTIYHLNLHGSSRLSEEVPEDENDENVFDIQQGVSILLCIKERDNPAPAKSYYTDMWGTREEKYRMLSETDVQTTRWTALTPTSSDYLFVADRTAPEDLEKYKMGWAIPDIFQISSLGIVTARDKLTIRSTPEAVRNVVTDFPSLPESEARDKYKLPKDKRDWQIRLAQADLRDHPDIEKHLRLLRYRPFDTRWTYYTGKSRGFHCRPRPKIMHHFLAGQNLGLCVSRSIRARVWQHALVTDGITDQGYVSNKGGPAHIFPLYLYPNPEELEIATERSLNFKPVFLDALSEELGVPQTMRFRLPQHVSAEEILAYIYAMLYNSTYREQYGDFLKRDFPRYPFTTGH